MSHRFNAESIVASIEGYNVTVWRSTAAYLLKSIEEMGPENLEGTVGLARNVIYGMEKNSMVGILHRPAIVVDSEDGLPDLYDWISSKLISGKAMIVDRPWPGACLRIWSNGFSWSDSGYYIYFWCPPMQYLAKYIPVLRVEGAA